jgi:hypothetical protein
MVQTKLDAGPAWAGADGLRHFPWAIAGALPAFIAAWIPNTIFAMIGFFYFTTEE